VPAALALGLAAGALSSCTVASGGHPRCFYATVRSVAVSPTRCRRPVPVHRMEALYAYFPAIGAQFTRCAVRGKLGSLEDKLFYPCMARSGFNLDRCRARRLWRPPTMTIPSSRPGKIQAPILSPQGPAPVPELPPTASTSVKREFNADLRAGNNAAEPDSMRSIVHPALLMNGYIRSAR
jgi:hypothetical protein